MFSYVESIILWLRKVIFRLSLPRKISKEKILRLPLVSYAGEIVIVDTVDKAHLAVAELEGEKVLGFDSESRPAFKKGETYNPSIIQLAGENKVYLFQLEKINGLKLLKGILEADDIMKVGVGVDLDVVHLNGLSNFTARNFFDLGELSHRLGVTHTGLRNLAAIFLKKRISKCAQLSDWSQPELTDGQKKYAATDAWISRLLYFKMRSLE
ncbi:MAG: 3'-5' exonuclease domain-containing protein 2 [Puniceicoccales bacterium]|jgi:ribonuclease D|nr:3'-5' exonuclease domain-containing protein 2 [Puniceicoccales bacterium]